jgi:hypothetical protein
VIDDPATVDNLMEQMQEQLPIPALPSKELVRMLRGKGLKIDRERVLFIHRVFYFGDEGGISCDVTPGGDMKEAMVVSLTHLRIEPSHPLYQPIRNYQRERVRRIAESES